MRPGAIAPDGSPVELYLELQAGDEPTLVSSALAPGADILELGCGVGRVTRRLLELGHAVVAVDQSPDMLAEVRGAETVLADIEGLDLGRRFACVLLASQLVNTAGRAQRAAFLATCARHVAPGGRVIVQRLRPDDPWRAGETYRSRIGPVEILVSIASREGALITATAEYRLGERVWRQPFRAEILDDEAIFAALADAGLRFERWLDLGRAWLAARPA